MIHRILFARGAPRIRRMAFGATAFLLLAGASSALAAWMMLNTNDGVVNTNIGAPFYTSGGNNGSIADYLEINRAWAVNDGDGFYFRLEARAQPAGGSELTTLRIGAGFDCNNDGDVDDGFVSGPDGDRKVVYWPNSDQVWIYSGTNQQIVQMPDNSYGERVGATYEWWVPIRLLPPDCRASSHTIGLALATVQMSGGQPQTRDQTPLQQWNHRIDYGDANNPDPQTSTCTQYPTRIGCNGARHGVESALLLGASRDADGGNNHGANADVDDLTNLDDEDGVAPTAGVAWTAGGTGSLAVTVSGADGYLNCWVDWNNDADWADADEKIISENAVFAGSNARTFSVPSGVTIANTSFIARCRLTPGQNQATAVTGAAEFGEVEDHKWSFDANRLPILPNAPVGVTGLGIANLNTVDVRLTWTNPAPNNQSHMLGHATDPYFTSCAGPCPVDQIITAAPWQYDHLAVRGAPADAYYYIVFGRLNGVDAATPSNRVGLFEFALTPGTP